MSNFLVKFVLLNTKLVVNSYTALTLPFYTIYQKPWQKLRLSKSFNIKTMIDKHGRTVYYHPEPPEQAVLDQQNPIYSAKTLSDLIKNVPRESQVVGVRKILDEQLAIGKDGKPIIFDDRELTKIKLADNYEWYNFGEIIDQVDVIARGLAKMGVKRGDKVMIYAENSLEWFMIAVALNRLCATITTLFSTLGDEGVVYGLNQSDAPYLVISESLLIKVDNLKEQIKSVQKIVIIPYDENSYKKKNPQLKKSFENLSKKFPSFYLDKIIEDGKAIAPYEFPQAKPEEISLIMYTSGTTGNPKGVILTNENLKAFFDSLLKIDEETQTKICSKRFPAYLPMAHLFGYLLNFFMFLSGKGGQIAISGPQTLMSTSPHHVAGQKSDLEVIQPEVFAGVPLVMERLIKEINKTLSARSQISLPLFLYLMDYKIRWTQRGYDTPIINKLICNKINGIFGGNLKMMVVSGAPLHPRLHAMVKAALNLSSINNPYGCTEVTGGATWVSPHDLSYGLSGTPIHGVKYYLDDWEDGGYTVKDKPNPRGEIVIGGRSVSQGYYKMPEQTAQDFYTDEDGINWFRTGDIGEVLPNGCLRIIDRKKDFTKLANGEFIAIGKVEAALRTSPYVENICVCTDRFRSEIIALIMPNKIVLKKLAIELNKENLSFEQMCDDPEINQRVYKNLLKIADELNLKRREIPVQIALVKEEWSQNNNLLTAAFKLRRKMVYDRYQEKIQELFEKIPNPNSSDETSSAAI